MYCLKCSTENSEQRKYCRECGSLIVNFCKKCDFCNSLADKFCGGCGIKLTKNEVSSRIEETPHTEETPSKVQLTNDGKYTTNDMDELIGKHPEIQKKKEIKEPDEMSQDFIDSMFNDDSNKTKGEEG